MTAETAVAKPTRRPSGNAAHTVSVVVPVFNSEQSLRELCERLSAVLAAQSPTFEIVLVTSSRSRGGQFLMTPAMASQVADGEIELSAFYVQYVQY